MVSDKQRIANMKNAKLGGVKTSEGRSISRFNALKHGILSDIIIQYDSSDYKELVLRLLHELEPKTAIEEMLVERIALLYVRLCRVLKAEKEYMLSVLNPHITETKETSDYNLDFLNAKIETTITKEGYSPEILPHVYEKLEEVYGRYEKSIENRMFKALHELDRIQRVRKGENILPPASIDINLHSDKE